MSSKELYDAFLNCSNQDEAVSLLSQYSSTTVKSTIDSSNSTLLHRAARRSWTRVCQILVEEYQVYPECRTTWGETPLHDACSNTPLYWACNSNRTDTVEYLVSNCYCDPLIKDNVGDTPFNWSSGVVRDYLKHIIG